MEGQCGGGKEKESGRGQGGAGGGAEEGREAQLCISAKRGTPRSVNCVTHLGFASVTEMPLCQVDCVSYLFLKIPGQKFARAQAGNRCSRWKASKGATLSYQGTAPWFTFFNLDLNLLNSILHSTRPAHSARSPAQNLRRSASGRNPLGAFRGGLPGPPLQSSQAS